MRLRGLLFLILGMFAVLPAAAQSEYAFIRVGHFSSDAPAVDVYLNGELSDVLGLAFGEVTPWMAIPAGTYSIAVTTVGQSVDIAVATLEDVELAAGTWATISAVGTLADETLALQPAVEDYATPVAEGSARVTLFHAIEDMSGVDLVRDGAPMINTVAYPNPERGNDGAASVDLLAGTVDLAVTGATDNSKVIISIPETELPDGGYVSVFAYGTLEAPLYSLQTVTPEEVTRVSAGSALTTETFVFDPNAADEADDADDVDVEAAQPDIEAGSVAFIRAGHFGADAPAVDVYLDDEATSITALEYGVVTDWIAVPAGEYTISVTAEGGTTDEAVISLEEVELAADSWTTLSVTGSLADETLALNPAVEDYTTAIAAGSARVTLFHAINGMSGVDLVRDGAPMINTVAYPNPERGNDGAASVDLLAGTVNLAVTSATNNNVALVSIPETVLPDGGYVSVFAYGTLDAPLYTVVTVSGADVEQLRSGN
jgi:hypothetical protein